MGCAWCWIQYAHDWNQNRTITQANVQPQENTCRRGCCGFLVQKYDQSSTYNEAHTPYPGYQLASSDGASLKEEADPLLLGRNRIVPMTVWPLWPLLSNESKQIPQNMHFSQRYLRKKQQINAHPVTHWKLQAPEERFPPCMSDRQGVWRVMNMTLGMVTRMRGEDQVPTHLFKPDAALISVGTNRVYIKFTNWICCNDIHW